MLLLELPDLFTNPASQSGYKGTSPKHTFANFFSGFFTHFSKSYAQHFLPQIHINHFPLFCLETTFLICQEVWIDDLTLFFFFYTFGSSSRLLDTVSQGCIASI